MITHRATGPSSLAWRLPFLSGLLFVSGACALVYQTAWLREFRLIFGGATPATAAVLAIFMGGLGFGGWWFGRWAERAEDPLRLYAFLEIGIGVAAGASPVLLDLARAVYLRTGGVLALGPIGASLAQMALTLVVLGPACILLGGNLPPAGRWIETDDDAQRGAVGAIYGCNALGAVVGVLGSTFWALEHLGTRATLWLAAVCNVAIGLVALGMARWEAGRPFVKEPARRNPGPGVIARATPAFVYAAAAWTGFTFFLAELVWYRLLTPLLGGSVYCFGMIVAEILFGIGVGGWLYRGWIARQPGRAHLGMLAILSAIQGAFIALPWALGDRVAVASYHLVQWRSLGFGGLVMGWAMTVAVFVWVPAILGGMQFPLLVALLGTGRRDVGRQVGAAYAANTAGAIAGSLLGGFILIPWLSAPGCWRLVMGLSLVLGFVALLLWERPWRPSILAGTLGAGILAVNFGFHAVGPTGAWRHASLGYGIVHNLPTAPAELADRLRAHRRDVAREYEGREASIAIVRSDEGYALFSNGKADGSALADVGTQVMLGLVAAFQHPEPRTAFVIGLGTATTAGWLADVPTMERVDVVELEPCVVRAARDFFGSVNRGALSNPRLHLIVGDAREVLQAGSGVYDLIVSEPPNPYRAGVAQLFTREYYQSIRRRLAPGGVFSQWLQGYQLSIDSVQIVYATLLSVFPHVETWATQGNDLAFVCRMEPPDYAVSRIVERLRSPLYAEAVGRAWLVNSAEGIFARHIAGSATARRVAAAARALNTDDRTLLEYGLARSQLTLAGFSYPDLLAQAVAADDDQPPHLRGSLDQRRLLEARMMFLASEGGVSEPPSALQGDEIPRGRAIVAWGSRNFAGVIESWRGVAASPAEQLMMAISMSRVGGAEQAQPLLKALQVNWPGEAAIASAWLAYRFPETGDAVERIAEAFHIMATHPWVSGESLASLVELTSLQATAHPEDAERLLQAWATPCAAGLLEQSGPSAWYRLAAHLASSRRLEVLEAIGPNYPWNREFLTFRLAAFEAAKHPKAAEARRELETYLRQEGPVFSEVLGPKASPPSSGPILKNGSP